jgi:iron complex outermembrane receptor protein
MPFVPARACRACALLAAGIAFAASPAPASPHEEAAPDGLPAVQDIVVTARFRNEALISVPVAISALEGEDLQAKNLNTIQDMARIVPALNFRTGSSNKDRSTFIRGIGTITTSPGVEPSVSTVIDGVVLARPGQSTLDLLDIRRIEVLRGPQGTLFGKNASAGVINIVSAAPAPVLGATAQLGYFEADEYRLRLGASGPLNDLWSFAATALLAGFDGNVRNVATGEHVNGHVRRGGRARLAFKPSADVRLTLTADYAYTRESVPTGVFASTSRVAYPSGAVTPNPDLANALTAEGIVPERNNTDVNPNFDASVRDRNYGTALTAGIGLGEYQLTSITSWRKWTNRQHMDWDQTRTLTPAIPQGEDLGRVSSDQFSQELRLTSPKGSFIDYVVGVYYFHTVARERYEREVGRLVEDLPRSDTAAAHYRTKLDNYSVFGEASFNLRPEFRAILGARLIHDSLGFRHARVTTTTAGVPGIRPSFASSGDTRETDYSLRAGVQYDFSDHLNAYFTYSRGYKGPAFNVFFNMEAFDAEPLNPETSRSYEIGLKGRTADHLVTFSLAAYLTEFKGFQANSQDLYLGALVTRLINAGEVSSRGVEADLTLRPFDGLSLSGSAAYNDAHIDRFLCPPSAGGSCANIDSQPLPFAPAWKVFVDGSYTFLLTDELSLQVQTDYSWKDATQYSISQTPDTIQPSYGIWGASVALLGDQWQVRGLVKNIANTQYSPFIFHSAAAGVSRIVPRDNRRYFGVSASIDF